MVEILNYESVVNKNKVIGYVDVKIAVKDVSMVIRKIAHLKDSEKEWFSLPTFARPKEDGTNQYLKYFQFSVPAHNDHILKEVSEKVKKFLENKDVCPF